MKINKIVNIKSLLKWGLFPILVLTFVNQSYSQKFEFKLGIKNYIFNSLLSNPAENNFNSFSLDYSFRLGYNLGKNNWLEVQRKNHNWLSNLEVIQENSGEIIAVTSVYHDVFYSKKFSFSFFTISPNLGVVHRKQRLESFIFSEDTVFVEVLQIIDESNKLGLRIGSDFIINLPYNFLTFFSVEYYMINETPKSTLNLSIGAGIKF